MTKIDFDRWLLRLKDNSVRESDRLNRTKTVDALEADKPDPATEPQKPSNLHTDFCQLSNAIEDVYLSRTATMKLDKAKKVGKVVSSGHLEKLHLT